MTWSFFRSSNSSDSKITISKNLTLKTKPITKIPQYTCKTNNYNQSKVISMSITKVNLPHQLAYQIAQTSTALLQNPQAQCLLPANKQNKILKTRYKQTLQTYFLFRFSLSFLTCQTQRKLSKATSSHNLNTNSVLCSNSSYNCGTVNPARSTSLQVCLDSGTSA